MSEQVEVVRKPTCDFCVEPHAKPAEFDGATVFGKWAFMCEAHFTMHGVGLGTGKGQRLIVINGPDLSRMCGCGLGLATQADLLAGYEHCMFCVETGPEGHESGAHDVMWDRVHDAKNSAF